MKLYFAGPLFNDAEKTFNLMLTGRIEALGYNVFLPQRDGLETKPENSTKDEKRLNMFCMDRDKVLESDVFLFVLDGRVPDEGACVELGIAYADKYINKKNRQIIGIHTDSRAAFIGGRLNPMVLMSFDNVFKSIDELIKYLQDKN